MRAAANESPFVQSLLEVTVADLPPGTIQPELRQRDGHPSSILAGDFDITGVIGYSYPGM
jgi:hypothetical protein